MCRVGNTSVEKVENLGCGMLESGVVLDVLVVEKDEIELVTVGTEFEVFRHFIFYVKIIILKVSKTYRVFYLLYIYLYIVSI